MFWVLVIIDDDDGGIITDDTAALLAGLHPNTIPQWHMNDQILNMQFNCCMHYTCVQEHKQRGGSSCSC